MDRDMTLDEEVRQALVLMQTDGDPKDELTELTIVVFKDYLRLLELEHEVELYYTERPFREDRLTKALARFDERCESDT